MKISDPGAAGPLQTRTVTPLHSQKLPVSPALQGGNNASLAIYIKDLRVAGWSIFVEKTSVARKGRCHFSQVAQHPFQVSRNRLLLARNLWG